MEKKLFLSHILKHPGKPILLAVALVCITGRLFSQQSEVMMKAVAIEKISMFIDWPVTADSNHASTDFVITVIGQNIFGTTLEELYRDKKIKDKKVIVNYLTVNQSPDKCDLLFVSQMRVGDLKKVIEKTKDMPVLIVSDTEGFADEGCFVNMYEFDKKLRFEINQKAMQNAGFKIDYRLLRVSKVLNPVIE